MTQHIEITCGEGDDAYQVTLTAGNLRTFYTASRDSRVKGKQGEALVAAFRVAAVHDGHNKIDPLEGLKSIERMGRFGRIDGPNGEAALQEFRPNGALQAEIHYVGGKSSDTAEGVAAFRMFDMDGDLWKQERHRDGKKHDGANGEPAVMDFLQGKLMSGAHYQDDVKTGDLTVAEINAYNRPGRELMKQSMTAAFPGLRVL